MAKGYYDSLTRSSAEAFEKMRRQRWADAENGSLAPGRQVLPTARTRDRPCHSVLLGLCGPAVVQSTRNGRNCRDFHVSLAMRPARIDRQCILNCTNAPKCATTHRSPEHSPTTTAQGSDETTWRNRISISWWWAPTQRVACSRTGRWWRRAACCCRRQSGPTRTALPTRPSPSRG